MKSKKKIIWVAILSVFAALIIGVCLYLNGTLIHLGSAEPQTTVQRENCSIEVQIDGKYISPTELDNWIIKRIRHVEQQLDFEPMEETNAEDMLALLTKEKLALSYDEIYNKLSSNINICNTLTNFMVNLSGGKTKNCVAEIHVVGLDADTFIAEFDRLQTENSAENLAVNLSVAPDHYYLGATDDGGFEVIETCGNNPVQSQFFITYGDKDALQSPRETDIYEYESAGIARTADGTIEGGVRHQFAATEDGFIAKLLVEFPTATPNMIIKNHQMHLACEFSHWISWVAENCT